MIYDVSGNVITEIYDCVGEEVPEGYDVEGNVVTEEPFDYTETFVEIDSVTINETKTGYFIGNDFRNGVKNIPLDYSRFVFCCTYSSGAVFGVFLSGTLAYFDGSSIKVYKTFTQNSVADLPPDSDIHFQQSCSLVDGETYTIRITRKSFNVVVEVNDTVYSAYLPKAGSAWSDTYRICEFGYVVFSGSIYAISSNSYMPYYGEHIRCAIFGDSITEGIGLVENDPTDYNKRYSWQLCKNLYDYDCVTCGVGGSTTRSAWLRFQNMIAAGYTIDDVIYYVGTNDGTEAEGISALTELMQSVVDGTKAEGCRVFWCIMPVATSSLINNARTASLAVTGAEAVIDFANVLPAGGAIHPDSAGQTLMYQEALSILKQHID